MIAKKFRSERLKRNSRARMTIFQPASTWFWALETLLDQISSKLRLERFWTSRLFGHHQKRFIGALGSNCYDFWSPDTPYSRTQHAKPRSSSKSILSARQPIFGLFRRSCIKTQNWFVVSKTISRSVGTDWNSRRMKRGKYQYFFGFRIICTKILSRTVSVLFWKLGWNLELKLSNCHWQNNHAKIIHISPGHEIIWSRR